MKKKSWIVFTDLDGTLLDASDYSFAPALPALEYLKKAQIPVIPCTSKTAAELELIRGRVGLGEPYIVENGSAVIFPPEWNIRNETLPQNMDEYRPIVLGKVYHQVLDFLDKIRDKFSLDLQGFSGMSLTEIASLTGLAADEASLAKNRQFSEPFVCRHPITGVIQTEMEDFCKNHGFRLLKGNRFFHLLGDCDKGMAVKKMLDLYQSVYGQNFMSIGLGDSMNDLELLQAVDKPVIIRHRDESFESGLKIPGYFLTQGTGPDGWQEAIFSIINHNAVDKIRRNSQ